MTLCETNESSGDSGSDGCLNANSSRVHSQERAQNHTGPRSLLSSYKIKSKNLTFSLTRGPGAGSATITYGQTGQIEMKVVNEAHVKKCLRSEGGREGGRQRKREGGRERERDRERVREKISG